MATLAQEADGRLQQHRQAGWTAVALQDPSLEPVWASRNLEPSAEQTWLLGGLRAVLAAGLGIVAARRDQVTAIGIGGLLIFTLLVSNIYYWQLLGLVALGWAARAHLEGRALAVVVAILLFQASTWWQLLAEVPVPLQGYQGSLGMLGVVLVVLVAGLWPGGRGGGSIAAA